MPGRPGAGERFEVVVTNTAAVGDDGMAWPADAEKFRRG
jgi:hypothetical protein